MASLSKQHADALASFLRTQQKPAIPDTAYSLENDFRVVHTRMHFERDELDDCEIHSYLIIRPRVVLESAARDRCGYRFGYNVDLGVVRRLTSDAPDGQPGMEHQMDACLEYVEWVQTIVGDNIRIGTRALTGIDIYEMPDQDRLSTGVWAAEIGFRYA